MPSVYSAFLHEPGQNVPWLVDTLMGSDIEWSLKMDWNGVWPIV